MKRVMIDAPRLDQWSEYMDSVLTPVLELMGERMEYMEIDSGTGGGVVWIEMSNIAALEAMWEGKLNEVTARIDGVAVLPGGRWFRSRMECVDFAENHIPVGQFQWFLDIVSHLQLVAEETVSTAESQRDEVSASKVRKTRYQCIIISAFKTDVPPILGGFGGGEEIDYTLCSYPHPRSMECS